MKKYISHSLVLFLRAGVALSSFLFSFLIAKKLSIDDAGSFFWCIGFITILAVIGRLGTDNIIVKNIGYIYGKASIESLLSYFFKIVKVVGSTTIFLFVIVLCFLKISLLNNELNQSLNSLVSMLVAFPLISFTYCCSFFLHGAGYTKSCIIFQNLLVNILFCGFLIFNERVNLTGLISAYINIYIVVLLLALMSLIYSYKKGALVNQGEIIEISCKQIFENSLPLWGMASLQQLIMWSSLLIGGAFLGNEELALLSVAQKMSMVSSLVLVAINTVVAPKFAKLYGENNNEEAKKLYRKTIRFGFLLSLPIVLFLVLFPSQLLGYVKPEYAAANVLLIIFSLGQLINSATGSAGFVLIMSGNEKVLLKSSLLGGSFAILGVFLLTTFFGMTGAALAGAIALAVQNLYCCYYIKLKY